MSEDTDTDTDNLSFQSSKLTTMKFVRNYSKNPYSIESSENKSEPSNPMNDQNNEGAKKVNHWTLFIIFSTVAVISVLINIRVFYMVSVSSKRKSRYVLLFKLLKMLLTSLLIFHVYIFFFFWKAGQCFSCSYVICRDWIYVSDLHLRIGKN